MIMFYLYNTCIPGVGRGLIGQLAFDKQGFDDYINGREEWRESFLFCVGCSRLDGALKMVGGGSVSCALSG
jgi:hypothetical protein